MKKMLFQIPQRYRFSSKSQRCSSGLCCCHCCFRYHKGTDFQANHNAHLLFVVRGLLFQIPQRYRFSSKSQHHFVITSVTEGCFRYHKGTDFQANHNPAQDNLAQVIVVLDTTKVQIFKQITTQKGLVLPYRRLFQIPQRYRFSSKSQRCSNILFILEVVLDTTKVQIFIKYNRETC